MEKNFSYNELPIRVVTDETEQSWFAGIDVCNILGYANANDIIKKSLDEDERKLEYLTDMSGQRRKGWNINEFGLYSLILSSTKPEAKAFKKWVTHEVLPTIRKAGRYTSEQDKEYEVNLQVLATEIQKLKDEKDEFQKKVNECRKEIDRKTGEMLSYIKTDRNQLKLQFKKTNT